MAIVISKSFGNVFDWRTANLVQKTDGTEILDSDPIGTFVAYKFNASNARSIDTTALTQSISDIKANGFRIYARSRNVASTAGLPPQIQIKITNTGQNITSLQVNAYSSTAFGSLLTTDRMFGDGGSNGIGTTSVFTEDDGVLVLDAGVRFSTETGTGYVGYSNSGSTATNGYFTIIAEDASQLPTQVQRVETSAWHVNSRLLVSSPYFDLIGVSTTEKIVSSSSAEIGNNYGSIDAQIMCDGAAPTGTTCSGVNELPGIAFDAPRAGPAYVCVRGIFYASEQSANTDFSPSLSLHRVATDGSVSAGNLGSTWSSLELINLQQWRFELEAGLITTNHDVAMPYYLCGIANLTAGKNGFVVAGESAYAQGVPTEMNFTTTRWNVFPIEQQLPQALITQGKVYAFNSTASFNGLASNTNTFLRTAGYLPAGRYRLELSGIMLVDWGTIPTYAAGYLFLSPNSSGGSPSDISPGAALTPLSRVGTSRHQGWYTQDLVVDWSGGEIHIYGSVSQTGGTNVDRAIVWPSLYATRLD